MAKVQTVGASPLEGMTDLTFEVFTDTAGDYRWRLVHENGNIMADGSEGYADKRDCMTGIERLKSDATEAPVVEVDG